MESKKSISRINKESEFSNFRESLVEHRLIADLMEYCWQRDFFDIQVLHSEIDDSGYDLVVSIKNKTSYLQLKITYKESKTDEFPIHQNLISKKNAFLMLIEYEKSTISNYKMYLKKIKPSEWKKAKVATNSHNREKERKKVRMIKRSLVTASKKGLSISEIFKILSKVK